MRSDEFAPLVGLILVVLVSVWLTFRYRRAFFTYWTLGYACVLVTLVLDLVTLDEKSPSLSGLALCASLSAGAWFHFAASASIRARGRSRVVSLLCPSVFLVSAFLLFVPQFHYTVAVVPLFMLFLAGTFSLGSALWALGSSSRWLATPLFAKGLWAFSYPVFTGQPWEHYGYVVDGLLMVAMGLGMLIFLLESHAHELQLLIDGNRQRAFFTLSTAGRILGWNSGAQRLFGFSEAEVVGRDCAMLSAPTGAASSSWPPIEHAPNHSQEHTRTMRRKDGSDFVANLLLSPKCSRAGQVEGYAILANDITERQRLEEERGLLASAIEQSGDAVAIANREGHITYANRVFEQRNPNRVRKVGQDLPLVCSPDTRPSLLKALAEGTPWRGRSQAAGSQTVEDLSVSPIRDSEDRISNFVLVARDVTREVELQDQLRHAQKMEELGRLASSLAHEFGNQLAVVTSYNHLLKQSTAPRLLMKATAAIDRATRRADAFVRQLLLLTRRDQAHPRVLALAPRLRESIDFLRVLVGKRIEVRESFDPRPTYVRIDPGQLDQLLFNLATNARDAMPNGGVLTFESTLSPDGSRAILRVADTGTGIAAELHGRIFEPFFTTKPPGAGTGLGLAVVADIVRGAGGQIEVESAPGQGARFRIFLPAQPAVADEKPAVKKQEPRVCGLVMVLEDEPALLESLCLVLDQNGHGAVGARSIFEARKLFETYSDEIDLLVIDRCLPEGDGHALGEELLRERPDLKAIFVTAYAADSRLPERLRERPGTRFLAKPIKPERLIQTVDELLA
jgi:PAS domain S-box-containing protein